MSEKVENVNIAFESILEAANEYSGFVLGMPEADAITAILGEDEVKDEKIEETRVIRDVMTQILDRTNGGLKLAAIEGLELKLAANNTNVTADKIFRIVHVNNKFSVNSENLSGNVVPEDAAAEDFNASEMQYVVSYTDPSKTPLPEVNYTTSSDGTLTPLLVSAPPPAPLNQKNDKLNIDIGNPQKYSPSLGAIIIKDELFGFNSRQAKHTPVFLSAVTPLEMSRCTPYLDIKVITRQKSEKNKMGIYNFLRIEDEGETFNRITPVANDDLYESDPSEYFGYMDLFTSPQTMVNGNLNRGPSTLDTLIEEEKLNEDFERQDVKDPFQPLMTLLGFDTTITGVGYGLMATKKANLKIKLHDKSRVKDLSSLLSPSEFGFTKFIIEFGWSHPDGDVTSTNTLGRYLNALRDESVYQLVNADYSFGNDSSVDITLHLVCSGFQQMKSVSAAGGMVSNLDVIQDEIEKRIDDLLISDNPSKKSVDDIRGELKIKSSDLDDNSNFIDFKDLSDYLLKRTTLDAEELLKIIFRMIFRADSTNPEQIENLINAATVPGASKKTRKEIIDELKSTISNQSFPTAGDIINAKYQSLPYGLDPFRGITSSKFTDNEVNDAERILIGIGIDGIYKGEHTSLGKIISMFVGYPMATCGLYDEVQLVFYPVNTQSCAARKHTTASFPIKLTDLGAELDRRLRASQQAFQNLSVHGFFSALDRIVSNAKIDAYGIYDNNLTNLDKELEGFQKKSFDEKYAEAVSSQNGFDAEDAASNSGGDTERAKKQAVVNAYQKFLVENLTDVKKGRIEEVYKAEEGRYNQKFLDSSRFSPVSLGMYFETFTMSNYNPDATNSNNVFEDVINFYKQDRRGTIDNGKSVNKTILRIHIYDERSNLNSDISLYGSAMENDERSEELSADSYAYYKNLLMSYHPTIIHGANSGVVNSININANTSGQLANILLVESYEDTVSNDSPQPEFQETVMLPATVSLEMMGFPSLARGQQIFIDFGTQTSLDNIYSVKNVNHTISQGNFKTSAVLVPINQLSVSSYRDRLLKKIANSN